MGADWLTTPRYAKLYLLGLPARLWFKPSPPTLRMHPLHAQVALLMPPKVAIGGIYRPWIVVNKGTNSSEWQHPAAVCCICMHAPLRPLAHSAEQQSPSGETL